MPILDAKTVFTREAALSGASVGTVIKGTTVWNGGIAENASQIVDQEKAGDAVGQELTVKVVAGGTAAISGTTASTLTVKLQTSDTTTDGNFEDLLVSPALKVTGKNPGDEIYSFRIPSGTKRYLRTTATVGGAAVTGVFSVFATRDL
jgi:hypothetical protein